MKIHTVARGENAYSVASEYGISPIRLAWYNELCDMGRLAEGRELLVLIPTRTYTTRHGDTLGGIARRFDVSEGELIRINPELKGGVKLIHGREIVIKSAPPTLGYGIGNGYFYKGCTAERLRLALPYISYLTICAYEYSSGGIKRLFDDERIREEGRKNEKIMLMRVYSEDFSDTGTLTDEAIKTAKGLGFHGITLCSPKHFRDEEILDTRKRCLAEDLLFFTEGLIDESEGCEYTDGSVLRMDKIHLKSIPAFSEYEAAKMQKFADERDSGGAFIELSAFARCADRYIEKARVLAMADKGRSRLTADEDALTVCGTVGRGRWQCEIVAESLKNTKAKLELISELGFRGIAFDIMRLPLCELMMFGATFSRPPVAFRGTVCNPTP